MDIKEFLEKYCEVNDNAVWMDGCYLTGIWNFPNDGEVTMDDKFLKFMIEHGIFHVESYSDFRQTNSNVACIGLSEKEQKWYGWSHRAVYGFGIGYEAKKGDLVTTSGWTDEYLKNHPEEDKSLPVGFKVQNMDDARRCAIAFAEAVS